MCFGCSKEPSHRNISFKCLKHNFMIEGKQPKPSETVLLNTQIVCFHLNKREFRSPKSTQRRVTNGLPAICHINGLSLVGR